MPDGITGFPDLFTNSMMMGVNIVFFAFFALSLVKIYANRKSIRLPKHLLFILISVCSWSIISITRFVSDSEDMIYFLSLLPYAFNAFSLIAVLFFIMRFYNLMALSRPHIVVIALITPLSIIMNIFIGHFGGANLIRLDPTIQTEKLNYVFGAFGSVYYAFFTICFTLSLSITALTIVKHIKLPKIYRAPSEKLLTGSIIISLGFIAALINASGHEGAPFDFSLFGFIFSIRFIYAATLGNQGLVFLSQARNDIIKNLNQSILILDEEKNIIFKNEKASKWLESLNFEGISYLELAERLAAAASKVEKLRDDESGFDYHFDSKGESKIFNLREKLIFDNMKKQIVTYVVYSDETENRQLIQRLEVGAGRDALTGLHNRSMMEQLKKELDKSDSLPLAVLICDLNNLKTTNDVHGHQAGDIMLRVCGESLAEKCPPTAQTGRIGGDEFLVLLPQTGKLEAEAVIESVREYLKGITEYPYAITMAIGYGIKEHENDNLDNAIKTADEAMYANKKIMKGTDQIRSTTELI